MQWIQHKRDYLAVQIFYLPWFWSVMIGLSILSGTGNWGPLMEMWKMCNFKRNWHSNGINMSGNTPEILEMISIIMCTFYTHYIVLRPRSIFGNY